MRTRARMSGWVTGERGDANVHAQRTSVQSGNEPSTPQTAEILYCSGNVRSGAAKTKGIVLQERCRQAGERERTEDEHSGRERPGALHPQRPAPDDTDRRQRRGNRERHGQNQAQMTNLGDHGFASLPSRRTRRLLDNGRRRAGAFAWPAHHRFTTGVRLLERVGDFEQRM